MTVLATWREPGGTVVEVVQEEGGQQRVIPGGQGEPDALHASCLLLGASSQGDVDVRRTLAGAPGRHARLITVDQTHTSVVVDDAVVVKWRRTIDDAAAVGARRVRDLWESGFRDMPEPVLTATWRGHVLATGARYLPDAQDGWTWAVDDLRAWAQGHGDEPREEYAALGRITAHLHAVLAREGVSPLDLTDTRARARRTLTAACAMVDGVEGESLRAQEAAISAGLESLTGQVTAQPIHGDLHLGQVLRTPDGRLWIIDFDGNPVLEDAERAATQPVARDVAGMLCAIDHVARIVIHRTPGIDAERVRAWIPRAQAAYLEGYRAIASSVPDAALLRAFRLEQECREYVYAVRHLPHWRYVPYAALPDLLAADGEDA